MIVLANRWPLLLIAALLCRMPVQAQTAPPAEEVPAEEVDASETPNPEPPPQIEGRSLSYWIEQLASDSYSRRQRATSLLKEAGDAAIGPLAAASGNGDFEVVSRTMEILQAAAAEQQIDDTGGAYGHLKQMAGTGIGARGVAARQVLASLERRRDSQAQQRLTEAGVFIGQAQFRANFGQVDFLVRIDDRWSGDVEVIKWVRWLRGLDTIVLSDSGCTDAVLQQVCRLPRLEQVQLNNGAISSDGLAAMANLKQIRYLELNYVELTGTPESVLADLPLSTALTIRGCDLSDDQIDKIRQALPAIAIEITRGAFLGVEAADVQRDRCEIGRVIEGGAASKAGMLPRDIIVELNGKPIGNFYDLKAVIGQQKPSTPLKIKVQRLEDGELKTKTLTATLQKINLP